jgi:tetratricopeptide (TPR) repeat protein
MWWILAALAAVLALVFWPTHAKRFRRFLLCAHNSLNRRDWERFDQHVAGALEAAENIRNQHSRDHALGQVRFVGAQAAYWRGNLDETERLLPLAVEHMERAGAPDRALSISLARHLWGDALLEGRQFDEAREVFREKAEYWSRTVARPHNIDVTRYQFHLAAAQMELGKLAEAVETLRQACDTAERDFGPGHPRTELARQKLADAAAQLG